LGRGREGPQWGGDRFIEKNEEEGGVENSKGQGREGGKREFPNHRKAQAGKGWGICIEWEVSGIEPLRKRGLNAGRQHAMKGRVVDGVFRC